MNNYQKHYVIIEKDAFAFLTAVRDFIYILELVQSQYTQTTPRWHFLRQNVKPEQKLLRWLLELQQYNLKMMHRAGKKKLIPDILSHPSQKVLYYKLL